MSVATARASTRFAVRTTCRAAATWVPSRTALPGFQDITRRGAPRQVRPGVGHAPCRRYRAGTSTADVRGDGSGRPHRALRHRREPGAERSRRDPRACTCSRASTTSVVQDIFLTKTAEMADVVLARGRGMVRERRHGHEQRAAGAARPQGARPTRQRPRRHRNPAATRPPAGPRLAYGDEPRERAEAIWDEVRSLSPMHAGMSYARIEALAASSGRATTRTRSSPRSCTAGCGTTIPRREAGRRPSTSSITSCPSTSSPTTSRCA